MVSCKAGDCEVECGAGKGCGCIAESDNPEICSCFCSGGEPGKDLKLEPATPVDVSISDLTVFDTATFLNGVYTETIVVPADRMSDHVSLDLKSTPFVDVLRTLNLTTSEAIERHKRRMALLMFFAGVVIGAMIVSLVF